MINKVLTDSKLAFLSLLGLGGIIVCLYAYKLGEIPYGFFCDEAMIGIRARELWQGNFSNLVGGVFYQHFHYLLGSLTVIGVVPMVAILGLNEFSVRLGSAFWTLVTSFFIYLALRKNGLRMPIIGVLVFVLAPVTIHIGRIYFGQTVSLAFISAGYYLWSTANQGKSWIKSGFAGLLFGIATYGYASFLIAVPAFVGAVSFSGLFRFVLGKGKISNQIVMLLVYVMTLVPIMVMARERPEFFNRFHDKLGESSLLAREQWQKMASEYLKYYSYDYLFKLGETDMAGSFVERHSVPGKGLWLITSLPFLAMGILGVFRGNQKKREFTKPFVFLLLVYPVVDIITTRTGTPPYTFALFSTMFFLPYLAANGADILADKLISLTKSRVWVKSIGLVITTLMLVESIIFYRNNYLNYPRVSSGYWGWQSGPREMLGYFEANEQKFDHFYMEGVFNEPQIFLDFYLNEKTREKASIGSIEDLPTRKRVLYGVSAETYNRLDQVKKRELKLEKAIDYPNGDEAFLLVTY